MALLQSKFIQDAAITGAKIASSGKQAVLESKLMGSKKAVITFATAAASSNVVTTQVEASAAVNTPQSDLITGEGIYTGVVSGTTDAKKVVIRQAGTDQGISDGLGDEIYGKLTEAAGVFTLSYFKGSDNAAFTFGAIDSIDFYFTAVEDLFTLDPEAFIKQSISGVIDADQSSAMAALQGAVGFSSEATIVYSSNNFVVDATDTIASIGVLDAALGGDLSFAPTNYANPSDDVQAHLQAIDTALGTALGAEFADNVFKVLGSVDASKVMAFEVDGISAATTRTVTMPDTDVDLGQIATNKTHVDGDGSDHQDVIDLVTLSGVSANSANHGAFSGATLSDTENTKSALQALETSLELKASASVVTEIDANVDDLITLSGVAENATDLGAFSGAVISDNVVTKVALQELETAVEGLSAQSDKCELFILTGTDITNKFVDLTFIPDNAACVQFHPMGGGVQDIGVDFNIITDGTDLKRVSWNTLALDGILAAADRIRIYYNVA